MQARGLVITIVAAALLPSCDASSTQKPAPKRGETRFEQIKRLTDQSCGCAMAGRNTAALDQRLAHLTAKLETMATGTSSVPLRGDLICYHQLGEQACAGRIVVTHSSSDSDFICTQKQADELLAVWDAAAPDDGTAESLNRTRKKRDEALLTRLKAMHAEAAKSIPQSACN